MNPIVALAAAVALATVYAAGYLTAWWRLHRRVARLATLADRLRAQVGELIAAMTAIPATAVEHRAKVANFRAKQVAELDTYYLDQRRAA